MRGQAGQRNIAVPRQNVQQRPLNKQIHLARSGSSSELSLRANISKNRKSWGFTEYQFLLKMSAIQVFLEAKETSEGLPPGVYRQSEAA